MIRRVTVVAALALTTSRLLAQLPGEGPVQDTRFDAASVRPLPPGAPLDDGGYTATPTRFSGRFSVRWLMRLAFDIHPHRIAEGPDWVKNEGYEINAVSSVPRPRGGLAYAIRDLLEDRFRLKVRVPGMVSNGELWKR